MGKIAHIALLALVVQALLLMVTALNYRTDSSSNRHVNSYYKIKYLCGRKYNVWCPYPSYAHYYANACKCVCKGGLKWDSSAKRCVCPYPGQIYNAHWKKCVCPSCQKWDSTAKRCVCPYPGQVYEARWNKCVCPNPLKFNKSSKRCVCPYPGQVFAAKEKKCVCPGELELSMNKRCQCPPCQPNFTLVQKKDQCECVCDTKCPRPFVLDRKSCHCVCPEGLVQDPKTKKCVCLYEGQVFNPNKGCFCPGDLELSMNKSCQCPPCQPNFTLVQKKDQCECVCDMKCPRPFVLDRKSCRCVCPEGLVLNPKTKKCVCLYEGQVFNPKTKKCVCPYEGQVLNPKTRQCVCPYEGQVQDPNKGCICPSHLVFDRDSRSCVCPECPPYFHSVQQGDECSCVCNRSCTGPLILDTKSCQCVCPEGTTFNRDTGNCDCPEGQFYDMGMQTCVCNGDKILNNSTGECECSPCPHAGYTLQQKDNACKCVCTVICGEGRVRNDEICACEEPTFTKPPIACRCTSKRHHPLEATWCRRRAVSREFCEMPNDNYTCVYKC